MLALRTAAIVALVAVMCVTFFAFRAWPEVRERLPGLDMYQAAQRFGWGCRPDPDREFGRAFFFHVPGKLAPDFLLEGRFGNPREWEGIIHVWATEANVALADEGEPHCQRVGGWLLNGDRSMIETLATQLQRP
jgi:hypothetical protein